MDCCYDDTDYGDARGDDGVEVAKSLFGLLGIRMQIILFGTYDGRK